MFVVADRASSPSGPADGKAICPSMRSSLKESPLPQDAMAAAIAAAIIILKKFFRIILNL